MFGWLVKLVAVSVAAKAATAFRVPVHGALAAGGRPLCVRAASDDGLFDISAENVEKVLDLVRPQLAADGGGVALAGVEDHQVAVRFSGACRACPHRTGTVKSVIESTLARFIRAKDGKQITVKLVDDDGSGCAATQ
ncbi:NifU-like scaffold protein, putative [Babesia caballi]|uniref:NifU-like scaffold protein, putative n=1 Tax=Babesia caballi TaxID=5871 RepID=A0AAV4M076_BABCB|nr:NifU-like scaffold protein, putative [Babesia caballi]